MRQVTGKPIKFVSMGEKPDSLEPFYPDRMAKRILGMGDVVGIIEKAQEAADAEQLEAAERMLREGFTMNDMLDQMKAVKKMGGMKGWACSPAASVRSTRWAATWTRASSTRTRPSSCR